MLTDASVEFIALVPQLGDMLLDGRVSVSKTEAALGRSGPGESRRQSTLAVCGMIPSLSRTAGMDADEERWLRPAKKKDRMIGAPAALPAWE
jgi:hypothetical protein